MTHSNRPPITLQADVQTAHPPTCSKMSMPFCRAILLGVSLPVFLSLLLIRIFFLLLPDFSRWTSSNIVTKQQADSNGLSTQRQGPSQANIVHPAHLSACHLA